MGWWINRVSDKKYQRFKRTQLHTDHVKFKQSRNQVKNLIKRKQRNYIKVKLTGNKGNSKELWKTLKKLGLPTKKESQAMICLGKEGDISFDPKANAETFKDFYSNLALDLVRQLPLPKNRFGSNSVKEYYRHLNLENNNCRFSPTPKESVLKLLHFFFYISNRVAKGSGLILGKI